MAYEYEVFIDRIQSVLNGHLILSWLYCISPSFVGNVGNSNFVLLKSDQAVACKLNPTSAIENVLSI